MNEPPRIAQLPGQLLCACCGYALTMLAHYRAGVSELPVLCPTPGCAMEGIELLAPVQMIECKLKARGKNESKNHRDQPASA